MAIEEIGAIQSATGNGVVSSVPAARSAAAVRKGGGAAPPVDGTQFSEEILEGDEADKRDDKKAREERGAEEQARAEKERELEELMRELQQALQEGRYDQAAEILRRIQDLLGHQGLAPAPVGAPAGVPAGAPAGVPVGIPVGAPVGVPAGAPARVPVGSLAGRAPVRDDAPAGQVDGEIKPPNGRLVPPLDNYTVTSEFGADRGDHDHQGIDLAAPAGTPVKAVADGTVTRIANDPDGYGNWVEIQHSDGSRSRYAHLSAFGKIKVGQRIGAGSVIGAVGSTGRSTGPHLHFEWRTPQNVAVNPRRVMNFA